MRNSGKAVLLLRFWEPFVCHRFCQPWGAGRVVGSRMAGKRIPPQDEPQDDDSRWRVRVISLGSAISPVVSIMGCIVMVMGWALRRRGLVMGITSGGRQSSCSELGWRHASAPPGPQCLPTPQPRRPVPGPGTVAKHPSLP